MDPAARPRVRVVVEGAGAPSRRGGVRRAAAAELGVRGGRPSPRRRRHHRPDAQEVRLGSRGERVRGGREAAEGGVRREVRGEVEEASVLREEDRRERERDSARAPRVRVPAAPGRSQSISPNTNARARLASARRVLVSRRGLWPRPRGRFARVSPRRVAAMSPAAVARARLARSLALSFPRAAARGPGARRAPSSSSRRPAPRAALAEPPNPWHDDPEEVRSTPGGTNPSRAARSRRPPPRTLAFASAQPHPPPPPSRDG